MRFKVTILLNNCPLHLPMSYNKLIQGIINRAMPPKEAEIAHSLIDSQQVFRKYTFSQMKGKYKVVNQKTLQFVSNPYFYVACLEDDLGYSIMKAVASGVEIFSEPYQTEVTLLPDPVLSTSTIRMLSPLTLRKKDRQTGQEVYLEPNTFEFTTGLYRNLLNKYQFFKGEAYTGPFAITANTSTIKQVVVRYERTNIKGFTGEYDLVVSPEAMQLLLDTGLGSKNAQGFGMFEILEKR